MSCISSRCRCAAGETHMPSTTTCMAWQEHQARAGHQCAAHGSPGADASPNHEIRTPNGYFRHGRGHDLLHSLHGGKWFRAPRLILTVDEGKPAGGLAETSTNLN
jgi:hypothetical protein